jgi:ring-1,2-phenylacetyl-CoA epoxidase subunit PaaC
VSEGDERGTSEPTAVSDPLATYALALGDDALVASQRLGWWISRAPQIEEDVALANIGLDQLGQARTLLAYAGAVEGAGRDEDDLAYFRDAGDFRNACLVERSQEDFAVTMVRLLLFATWQHELYADLAASTDATLAGVAGKAVRETAYHVEHARHWVLRLGDGTEESHRRTQAALDAEWPWRAELFDASWLDPGLVEAGIAVDPAVLRPRVEGAVTATLRLGTLAVPEGPEIQSRGRHGRHTEEMGPLLAEMQSVARAHPGVTW